MNVTVTSSTADLTSVSFPEFPRAHPNSQLNGALRMRLDFAPDAYAFMSVDEAALLHARLGAALVAAGKVMTP